MLKFKSTSDARVYVKTEVTSLLMPPLPLLPTLNTTTVPATVTSNITPTITAHTTTPCTATAHASSKTSLHSGQAQDACAVAAIISQRKIQKIVESFTLTAKLYAVSENLSFLR